MRGKRNMKWIKIVSGEGEVEIGDKSLGGNAYQRSVFKQAIALGWKGKIPHKLGCFEADVAFEEAHSFLATKGTELAKAHVTIMGAVEEAILFLESSGYKTGDIHDNLVRALGELQKLREGLGGIENSIVAMGCEISGH